MKRIDLRRFWQENAEYGIQNRADFVVSNADGPEGTQSAALVLSNEDMDCLLRQSIVKWKRDNRTSREFVGAMKVYEWFH